MCFVFVFVCFVVVVVVCFVCLCGVGFFFGGGVLLLLLLLFVCYLITLCAFTVLQAHVASLLINVFCYTVRLSLCFFQQTKN